MKIINVDIEITETRGIGHSTNIETHVATSLSTDEGIQFITITGAMGTDLALALDNSRRVMEKILNKKEMVEWQTQTAAARDRVKSDFETEE